LDLLGGCPLLQLLQNYFRLLIMMLRYSHCVDIGVAEICHAASFSRMLSNISIIDEKFLKLSEVLPSVQAHLQNSTFLKDGIILVLRCSEWVWGKV